MMATNLRERPGASAPPNSITVCGRTIVPQVYASGDTGCCFPPSLRLSEVEGKGLGVICTVNAPRGSLLLEETPLVRKGSNAPTMSPEQRTALWQLHDNSNPKSLHGLWATNAIGTVTGGTTQEVDPMAIASSIYLCGSRLNHSCTPNTRWMFPKEGVLKLYAVDNIAAGEELTVAYDTPLIIQPYELRRANLTWWACRCTKCTTPDLQSDKNRQQIAAAMYEEFTSGTQFLFDDVIKRWEEAIQLSLQEGIGWACIPTICLRIAVICVIALPQPDSPAKHYLGEAVKFSLSTKIWGYARNYNAFKKGVQDKEIGIVSVAERQSRTLV
eukprot:TRINITY_DN67424_c0_g2_i6.p1 TRINITY_DN67424_c0_g2~~TRINITY_DN67424_c0_g2_i6.p1  ORF type:complete len:328 (+),score=-13.63 TRINITY_DN67424_c0_g2_i6:17-1000(+)